MDQAKIEPVKAFLSNALHLKLKGDTYLYSHVIQQIKSKDDPETLWSVYIALSSLISTVTSRPDTFRDLFQSLYTFDWNSDGRLVEAFASLVYQIVSSNPVFLLPTMQMLVRNLYPEEVATIPDAASPTNNEKNEARVKKLHRIHTVLHDVIQIAPTCLLELHRILEDNFPHKRHSQLLQSEYTFQLLTISTQYQTLQPRVIDLIISKCVEIDVEIVIEETGEVKLGNDGDDNDISGGDIFQFDEDMTDVSNSYSGDSVVNNSLRSNERSFNNEQRKISASVADMADKLDAMLSLMIRYFDDAHAKGQDHGFRVFTQLLASFEERIMTTYKSKFVQFLMFHICSLEYQFAVNFAFRMIECFLDHRNHVVARQSAVIYLGSFLARAKYLSKSFVSDALTILLKWCLSYLEFNGEESAMKLDIDLKPQFNKYWPTNRNRHGLLSSSSKHQKKLDEFGNRQDGEEDANFHKHDTFLCCVQAMCYVMCFHGVSLAKHHRTSNFKRRCWETIIDCELEPIKSCILSVRTEFLRLSAHTGLLRERIIVENMKNPADSISSIMDKKSSTIGKGDNPLDSFFPFDPCLLVQVNDVVERYYRQWRGVPGLDCEDELEEIEAKEEEEYVPSDSASLSSSFASANHTYIPEGSSILAMSYGNSYVEDKMNISNVTTTTVETTTYSAEIYAKFTEKRSRNFSVGSSTGSW